MIKKISYKDRNFDNKLLASFQEIGFAVITDHEIPKDLIENAYDYWQEFYNSTTDFKKSFLYNPQENNQGGYFPFKSENAKDQKVSDLKEFYHFYRNGRLPVNPINVTGRLEPMNIHANPQAVIQLFVEMEAMGVDLLRRLNNHLPDPIWRDLNMDLEVMAFNSPSTLFRSIHYPPIAESDNQEGAVRAAAHEDINLITLLPAATASGLEVRDLNGKWHEVKTSNNDIVVNVGDMLQLATGGFLKSTTHRVVNTVEGKTKSRYSMPMFIHPWPEVKLSPETTAEQYLIERLKEIGLKK